MARDFESVLGTLNLQQRRAVEHGDSPLLIVAGAGTGKTTTLAHRVARIIADGTDPSRILLLTFSRRAAAEMLRRVEGILHQLAESPGPRRAQRRASSHVWGGTFHSVAARLLRRHGRLLNLSLEFTILDRSDSEDLIHVLRDELNLSRSDKRFPLKGTCHAIYSRVVNTQCGLDEILEQHYPWVMEHVEELKSLFSSYVDRKEELSVLDYDDLLLFWRALISDPAGSRILREQFQYVLVDEYQDTNVVQADILRGLCPGGQGLTVVGDDAQSIYSFRAATVRNILDFPQEYPGTEVVPLEQNYRSTQPILDASNAVIAEASERHEKSLWSERTQGEAPWLVGCYDEHEQTQFVIERILEHRESGIRLAKQAVLFRASHHSMDLELELGRRNIPFHKYGGLRFIETAHVKDLLAFLKFAENPRDAVAGMRVLTLLPGIGPQKARKYLSELAEGTRGFRGWLDSQPPAASKDHWPLFVTLLSVLAKSTGRKDSVARQVAKVRAFYVPILRQKYDHHQARGRDLEQLEAIASRYESRVQFLTELTLDPPSSTQDLAADPYLDEDYLNLSTIHSAKGLEWDAVYVIHASDGNIPSDMATGSSEEIDEERRLFYVAMTRAKDWLYISHPLRYYRQNAFRTDTASFSQLTRFITRDALPYFERHSPDEEDPLQNPHAPASTSDIRSSIKSIWN